MLTATTAQVSYLHLKAERCDAAVPVWSVEGAVATLFVADGCGCVAAVCSVGTAVAPLLLSVGERRGG